MVQKILGSIGDKIKKLRTENNLSIQKLADLSGVSPAGVYKVENNEMVPSIAVLLKISKALDKRVSYFIEEIEKVKDVELVEADARQVISDPNSRLVVETIASNLEDQQMFCAMFTIKPGAGTGKETTSHAGEEIFLCLSGSLEIEVADTVYVLNEGDSIHFRSRLKHRWRNRGRRIAKVLYVITPPAFTAEVNMEGNAK